MSYTKIEPESNEYKDRLVSVFKAVKTLKEDLFLLDPSERAVLIKDFMEEVSPREIAMTMYYGNTTRATLIANLIRQEEALNIEHRIEGVIQ